MGVALDLLRLSPIVSRLALFRAAKSWLVNQPQWNQVCAMRFAPEMGARREAYPAIANDELLAQLVLQWPSSTLVDAGIEAVGRTDYMRPMDFDSESCGYSRRPVHTSIEALLAQACLPSAVDTGELSDPEAFPEPPVDAKFLANWHRADYRDRSRSEEAGSHYLMIVRLDELSEASIAVGAPEYVDYYATWMLYDRAVFFEDSAKPYEELQREGYYSDTAIPVLDYYGTSDGTALAIIWSRELSGLPIAQN